MSILSLKDASVSLKAGPLFEKANLEIEAGDKIGLIGNNGSGKTSLLAVFTGRLPLDSGEVAREKGFTYSHLPQNIEVPEGATIGNFLYAGDSTEIRAAAGQKPGGSGEGMPPAYALPGAGIREKSGGRAPAISLENRYKALCRELGFDDMDEPMGDFSGGEKKKVALARALAPNSGLLLLDEPTNHLDVETIEWLEEKLRATEQAFILVTHDRWFLDAVSDSIVEIERHELRRYEGSYAKYLERKAIILASLDRMENKRLANLKIELEWLNRGARARATKSERRKKEIEGMRQSLLEKQQAKISFASRETRLGKKVCVFRELGLSFGPRRLFGDFSWEIGPGEKIGIVGPNGSGKTSLLKIIKGAIQPTEGSVEIGGTVRMSVFEQTNEALDGEMSVVDFISGHADRFALPGSPSTDAESLLERFGFPRDFQRQKLKTLSGGELRRLMLVRILAESPNFLLLDEPTNDLDIGTIESLEEYCAEFKGSIAIVSHDRLLVDRLAEELLVLDGRGGIEPYHGSYFEWRLRREEAGGKAARFPPRRSGGNASKTGAGGAAQDGTSAANTAPGADATVGGAKSPKLSFKEKRELALILEEIDALESEKKALEAEFQTGDPASLTGAGRRYEEIDGLLRVKLARWEELAARE